MSKRALKDPLNNTFVRVESFESAADQVGYHLLPSSLTHACTRSHGPCTGATGKKSHAEDENTIYTRSFQTRTTRPSYAGALRAKTTKTSTDHYHPQRHLPLARHTFVRRRFRVTVGYLFPALRA